MAGTREGEEFLAPLRAIDALTQAVGGVNRFLPNDDAAQSRDEGDQYNKAVTRMGESFDAFFDELESDPGYGTYVQRFAQWEQRAQKDITDLMTNKNAIELFREEWAFNRGLMEQKVVTLANITSRAAADGQLVTSLDLAMRTTPLSIDEPEEFMDRQNRRIDFLIETAKGKSEGAISDERGEELSRVYKANARIAFSTDLMINSVDQLLQQGLSGDRTAEILEDAIRLEGKDYVDFINSLEGEVSTPLLQKYARAYQQVDLAPEVEDGLVATMQAETKIRLERKDRLDKADQAAFQLELAKLWADREGYHDIARNQFAMLFTPAGKLTGDQVLSWQEQYRIRVERETKKPEDALTPEQRTELGANWVQYEADLATANNQATTEDKLKAYNLLEGRILSDSLMNYHENKTQILGTIRGEQNRLETLLTSEEEKAADGAEQRADGNTKLRRREQYLRLSTAVRTNTLTFDMIDAADDLTNAEAQHFIDELEGQELEIAEGKYNVYVRAWEGEVEDLGDAPTAETVEAMQEKLFSDENLSSVDRRYLRAQIEAVQLTDQAAIDKAQRHLNQWKEARNKYEKGDLTVDMVHSYDTFDESDFQAWNDAIEQQRLRNEGKVVKDKFEVDDVTIRAGLSDLFWNKELYSDDQVLQYLVRHHGDGLSTATYDEFQGMLNNRTLIEPPPGYNDVRSFVKGTFAGYEKFLIEAEGKGEWIEELQEEKARILIELERFLETEEYIDTPDSEKAGLLMDIASELALSYKVAQFKEQYGIFSGSFTEEEFYQKQLAEGASNTVGVLGYNTLVRAVREDFVKNDFGTATYISSLEEGPSPRTGLPVFIDENLSSGAEAVAITYERRSSDRHWIATAFDENGYVIDVHDLGSKGMQGKDRRWLGKYRGDE